MKIKMTNKSCYQVKCNFCRWKTSDVDRSERRLLLGKEVGDNDLYLSLKRVARSWPTRLGSTYMTNCYCLIYCNLFAVSWLRLHLRNWLVTWVGVMGIAVSFLRWKEWAMNVPLISTYVPPITTEIHNECWHNLTCRT